MSHEARREAAERVARDHRPLAAIFADLRGGPPPAEPLAPPAAPPPPPPASAAPPTPPPASAAPPPPAEVVARAPDREPAPSTDDPAAAIDVALRRAVASLPGSDDPDEVAYDLAMAIEPALAGAAERGARAAYAAGVPETSGPGDAGLDVAPEALADFAAAVVSDGPHAAARLVRDTARLLATVAGNAGFAAVTRAAPGWTVVQRFGSPYCPAAACYGHDGRELLPEHGVPPYAGDCNCDLEPLRVGG